MPSNDQIAAAEEARKNQYTGFIQTQVGKIPDDYSPQQRADITTAEMGGIDVGYGNLKDELLRRASATGGSAGVPESLMEMGRESVRAKADAGAKLAETFANVPVQRALQQASIFQPALSGMLYNRYPTQPSNTTSSLIGAGGAIASTLIPLIFNQAKQVGSGSSTSSIGGGIDSPAGTPPYIPSQGPVSYLPGAGAYLGL